VTEGRKEEWIYSNSFTHLHNGYGQLDPLCKVLTIMGCYAQSGIDGTVILIVAFMKKRVNFTSYQQQN